MLLLLFTTSGGGGGGGGSSRNTDYTVSLLNNTVSVPNVATVADTTKIPG